MRNARKGDVVSYSHSFVNEWEWNDDLRRYVRIKLIFLPPLTMELPVINTEDFGRIMYIGNWYRGGSRRAFSIFPARSFILVKRTR